MNYYEILGLTYGASISDVKASFRQLAKMYHPDVNPEGLEHFTKVLKAYETLSDPVLKQSYDYKLNYHQAQSQQQHTPKNSKTWTFTEKELKRRQYYDEHIRKYAKQRTASSETAEVKAPYNEFKYILYATPLAVILFVIVMALAKRPNPTFQDPASNTVIQSENSDQIKSGEDVYSNLFGPSRYSEQRGQELVLKNETGNDAIVCFFNGNHFVRSFYMAEGDTGRVIRLPGKSLFISYASGEAFDTASTLTDLNVKGVFTRSLRFFKQTVPLNLQRTKELALANTDNSFEETTAADFFKNINMK